MQPDKVTYGMIFFNTEDWIYRIYDGKKWVTYNETDDDILKILLTPAMTVDGMKLCNH